MAGCTLLQRRPVATGPPRFCKFYILAYVPGETKVRRWLLPSPARVRLPTGPQRLVKLLFLPQSQPNLYIRHPYDALF